MSFEAMRADLLELRQRWIDRAEFFAVFAEIAAADTDTSAAIRAVALTIEQQADELMSVLEQHLDDPT